MFKTLYISLISILLIISCSTSKTTSDDFVKLLAKEEYMKNIEPYRIFNPASAMVIATLPKNIGNLKQEGNINDYEIAYNGMGYSKRYINKSVGKGYWTDIFAYNMKQTKISNDINDEIVKSFYELLKKSTLKEYENHKILKENTLVFTTPSGNFIKMKQFIFEYWNSELQKNITSYILFGTTLESSFYKIRINYYTDLNVNNVITNDINYFIKDFAYYFAEGISLNDFDSFKNTGKANQIKMEIL